MLFTVFLSAQDKDFAREIIDTLTSPAMHGRGYVKNGDQIAANFIGSQFEKFELKTFGNNYFQPFSISINTFPDTIEVYVDNHSLVPGKDFVISSSSPATSGTYNLVWALADDGKMQMERILLNEKTSNDVFITGINLKAFKEVDSLPLSGLINLVDNKIWWHVSDGYRVKNYFHLQIERDKMPKGAKTITVHAQSKFIENYQTQNVIGWIKGKIWPDSFYVFTAHYDHLGQMGPDVYFSGANDNASGTAMIIDMARFYSDPDNQPDYSIAFMAFSAEEAGLKGSSYYANNPLFPLDKIKFLINLDMVGSGSEGIKVVNGTIFKNEFDKLVQLNNDHQFINSVNKRGEAANSDHYPFYAKGVPSFFIYTLGDECKEYHNIYDISENVPLTEYEDLFKLLTSFINAY